MNRRFSQCTRSSGSHSLRSVPSEQTVRTDLFCQRRTSKPAASIASRCDEGRAGTSSLRLVVIVGFPFDTNDTVKTKLEAAAVVEPPVSFRLDGQEAIARSVSYSLKDLFCGPASTNVKAALVIRLA